MSDTTHMVTELLHAWRDGDESAVDKLFALVEPELHSIARREMAGERQNHTLQPTALVHEVYLRLMKPDTVSWETRTHFLAFAAITMKRILVDHARKRSADKRIDAELMVSLHDLIDVAEHREQEILALEDALHSLSKHQPRQSRAVELRFFSNMTDKEIGTVLGVSDSTAKRDIRKALIWLRRELGTPEDPQNNDS